MDEPKQESGDLRPIIQGVIEEFVRAQQVKAEPAYKAELLDERKRREDLERRMNDLVQENQRSRQMALQAELVWAFLPPRTLATDRVLVSVSLEPAYEAGGDAFDYSLLGDHLHVSIFDALGHDLFRLELGLARGVVHGVAPGCQSAGHRQQQHGVVGADHAAVARAFRHCAAPAVL